MNRTRRKSLQSIIDQIEALRETLEDIKAEEEEYMDNMPENLQISKKFEKAEESVCNMDDAINALDEAMGSIESAIA